MAVNLRDRIGSRRLFRPALEQLENRLAPAVYHVNTVLDTAVANLQTGQDASGHVSLRAAISSANAGAQANTIILPAGVYNVQNPPLQIKGNLQIIGAGPEQTVLQTRHLDRIFETDLGSLQLSGLTLNGGIPSSLLQGDVTLSNCQVTDTDVAALVAAALYKDGTSSPPLASARFLTAGQPSTPALLQPVSADDLVAVLSKSGGARSGQESDASDSHQAFFQILSDSEQSAPEVPDEM